MPGTAKHGTWNDRLIEKLNRLWAEGKSARDIGETLGVGKNAVIGKAHRLGLTQRRSPIRGAVKKGAKQPNKAPAHVKIKELMQTPRSPTPYAGRTHWKNWRSISAATPPAPRSPSCSAPRRSRSKDRTAPSIGRSATSVRESKPARRRRGSRGSFGLENAVVIVTTKSWKAHCGRWSIGPWASVRRRKRISGTHSEVVTIPA